MSSRAPARAPQPKPPANLIPLAQAAALVGCSPWTVRRWIQAGDIHGWRTGKRGRVLVDPDELQAKMLRPIVAAPPRKAAAR